MPNFTICCHILTFVILSLFYSPACKADVTYQKKIIYELWMPFHKAIASCWCGKSDLNRHFTLFSLLSQWIDKRHKRLILVDNWILDIIRNATSAPVTTSMLVWREEGGGIGAVLPLPPSTSITLLLVLVLLFCVPSLMTKLVMLLWMLEVPHCLADLDMRKLETGAPAPLLYTTHPSLWYSGSSSNYSQSTTTFTFDHFKILDESLEMLL